MSSVSTSLFASLLPRLAVILELTQRSGGVATPQAKQALLQATNDFKNTLAQTIQMSQTLSGGELSLVEQDELIRMLEYLRDRKREQLERFSSRILVSQSSVEDQGVARRTATRGGGEDTAMEIDSTASTPQ